MNVLYTEIPGQKNITHWISNYGQRLSGFIRSRIPEEEEAEDILQEVWYQLSSQVTVDDIHNIAGWLFGVARNKIHDFYRNRKRKAALTDDDPSVNEMRIPVFSASESNDPAMKELRGIFRQKLLEALGELPAEQRLVFILNEMEEIKLRDIAAMEGENLKTIISRKRYAVRYLRKKLEKIYQEFLNN